MVASDRDVRCPSSELGAGRGAPVLVQNRGHQKIERLELAARAYNGTVWPGVRSRPRPTAYSSNAQRPAMAHG